MSDRPVVYWCLSETGPNGAGLTVSDPREFLSQEEIDKYERLRFPKRREEWLLGRITAKSLIKACVPELAEVDYRSVTIANRESGAPYATLNGNPLALQLSISHRQGMAAAAVTLVPEIGLGIDLEWVEERGASFYSDYFTQAELLLLMEGSASQVAHTGTLIWSAKEAMLKALGQGLRLDTRSVEVLRIAKLFIGGWSELEVHAPAVTGNPWQGYWRQIGNTLCTIALVGAPNEPILEQIPISNQTRI